MLDPRWLEALTAVVDESGFDRAAQRLCLTQSAVSQRIRQLEEHLGQPVVSRTQPPEPTPAGRRLIQHHRQMRLLEQELLGTLAPATSEASYTRVSIGVNADSLATWFLEAARPAVEAHRLLLDIRVDDQDYTHALMRDGDVIGCVSTQTVPLQGGECRFLGAMRYHCLATPAFSARHFPHGLTAAALASAPAILYSHKDDIHSEFLASALDYHGPFPSFRLPSAQGFLECTLQGMAYCLLPEMMTTGACSAGRLVDLLPGQWVDIGLYWHQWRIGSQVAASLADTLEAYGRANLRPSAEQPAG